MAEEEATPSLYHVMHSEDGITWTRIGAQENARGSDEALRLFFPDPTQGPEGHVVAIARSGFRPKKRERKVTASLTPVELDPVPAGLVAVPDAE
jgi:hypothetical protein